MIALALLVGLLPAGAAQRGARPFEVRLAGPLEVVELDWGAAGRTRLVGPLLEGETRRLVVPAPLAGERRVPELRPRVAVDGRPAPDDPRVTLEGWSEAAAADPWAGRPRGLRARTRAPVGPASGGEGAAWGGELGPGAWALLVAAALLALGLRRRPLAALAAGAAVGCALLWLAARPQPAPAVRVLEGRAASWVRVDSGWEALAVEAPAALLEVVVEPEGTPVGWTVALAGDAPAWRAAARGARLHALSAIAPVLGLGPEANRWRPLAAAWTRDERGAWSAHGPWPLEAPLPPARPDAAPPPGWLASGLPQGVRVLVGRLAAGARTADAPPTWVRRVGP